MESRFGVSGITSDGIFFTEDVIADASPAKQIKVEISRQNSNLSEVKRQMAQEAEGAGANVIMNFRYGQRKHDWWQLLAFKWDTESWYGEGVAVKASERSGTTGGFGQRTT